MKIKHLSNIRLLFPMVFLIIVTGCNNSNDSEEPEAITPSEPNDVRCPP
jgi:hypothetical protein